VHDSTEIALKALPWRVIDCSFSPSDTLAFTCSLLRSNSSRLSSNPDGNAIEPVTQELTRSERSRAPRQNEKGRLKGILRRVEVTEHHPASSQDHWPMAINNGLKCKRGGFVVSSYEKFQQLRVAHRTVGTQSEQPVKIPTDSSSACSHHPSLT
jgi:hypothetical protein